VNIYKDCRNPVLPPYLHIADPEAHVMPDGRVYVYGSWDQGDDYYCSREYLVFSSDNMVDWVNHDVAFDVSRVPWANDPNAPRFPAMDRDNPTPLMAKMREQRAGQEGADPLSYPRDLLFAPDAAYYRDRYYLYFCLSDGSEGVAVGSRPEGPFTDAVRLPCGGIDPAVFVDTDPETGHLTQAYYTWGQFRARGAMLDQSMTALVPGSEITDLVTEEEHGFHEGSSLRKRGDTYYLVYCSIARGRATSLAYATSKSPLGPYTYGGILIDNDGCDPETWNNHGSIECVNGQWYVFYHRSSQNSRIHRRLCIEPITFNADGSIDEVPMTSQGAGRPFEAGEIIEAWLACGLSGSVYIGPILGTGEGLTNISAGDEALYRYVQWEDDVAGLAVEARGGGEITFYIDDDETPAGRARVQNGHTSACWFSGPSGKHTLRLQFTAADGLSLRTFTIGEG